MLAVVGTVPDDNFPLTVGRVEISENRLSIEGKDIDVNRGTPALLGAMVKTLETIGNKELTGFLVGDTGLGAGSEKLYKYLVDNIKNMNIDVIVFHYLQPDVDWHNKILFKLQNLQKKPVIIADAGFMYAAKMSGLASSYDLFTPDAGELAFLADEKAPHPFYTRGFILHENNKIPDLISRAYSHENAAQTLLVKGSTDYIADRSGIISSVNKPATEAMEAMGGTGDTVAGIVTALIGNGIKIEEAAEMSAKTNRLAGFYANPTPASQINDIIKHIPQALNNVLDL